MAHEHRRRERPVTPEQWDARYAERDQVWSGAPNGTLVAEFEGRAAGRALDVGCGEGADAIWLAGRGWRVTATDISAVALDRARRAAQAAAVEVDWRLADIADGAPEPGGFDLVTTHYPALQHTDDAAAIRGLLDAVAPGRDPAGGRATPRPRRPPTTAGTPRAGSSPRTWRSTWTTGGWWR